MHHVQSSMAKLGSPELVPSDITLRDYDGQPLLDADLVKTKGYFWEEKHERRKEQLEGKEACVREACDVRMQGRPNDDRVSVFAMYCNG
jgi:hypothetical protein